jgi:eukaryotic-like serine/threonine-protein kinase
MTVPAGTRFGPYEIVALLGAGGMGEVYRARDTRLGRDVAIKVLPAHLSASPEARQRFEREARAISQLTHAHICTLYDVGSADGTEYLVMELLEGETLTARLARGPLPLDQALRCGQEIAGALDQAHRLGIVHRDLKPANIMLTKSGVKLLDFGLAKVFAPPAGSERITSLPTQANVTEAGTILGTFQYMAPEQLEGREADARTDIFALGEVLYEVTTGARAFEGSTRASLISAILRDEPKPISQLQPMAPAPLDRIVRKCLAKDPEDRWQSARDVAGELEWIRGSGSGPAAATARHPKPRRGAWIAAAALASVVAVLLLLRARPPKPFLAGAIRFEVPPPETGRVVVSSVTASFFALSPDGRKIAFCATSPSAAASFNGAQIFVRVFDAAAPQAIAGTEGAFSPFWSPDGAALAFFAEGKLKKVSVSGGPPSTICDVARGGTGTWGRDGVIVFSEWGSGRVALSRVPATGGKPSPATRLDAARKERWHAWPVFLPDGRHFLFMSEAGEAWPASERGVYVATLGSFDVRFVAKEESAFAYVFPGFLVFARAGALLAQRFDPDALKTEGEPMALAPEVQSYAPTGAAYVSASSGAPMIAYSEGASRGRLVWVDRAGKEVGSVRGPDHYSSPRLSPDGKRLAFALVDPRLGTTDVWIQDLERGTATRVNFGPASESFPAWAPDGRRIFFSADQGGAPPELFEEDLASMKSAPLPSGPGAKFVSDVSPDGRLLAYTRYNGGESTVEMTNLNGEKKSVRLLPAGSDSVYARFSPDGRFVAYGSDESGKEEIYVRPLSGSDERWQISRDGGEVPVWSADGKELYYLEKDTLMAASVRLDRGFEAGVPKALFSADFKVGFGGLRAFDVTSDGRFLLLLHEPDTRRRGIDVIANWGAGLGH